MVSGGVDVLKKEWKLKLYVQQKERVDNWKRRSLLDRCVVTDAAPNAHVLLLLLLRRSWEEEKKEYSTLCAYC